MNWKNLFIASAVGAAAGMFEGFLIVSLALIFFSSTNVNTSSQIGAAFLLGMMCAAPPGLMTGLIGGWIGGFTARKPETPTRAAIIRGLIGGLAAGLIGTFFGYFLSFLGG